MSTTVTVSLLYALITGSMTLALVLWLKRGSFRPPLAPKWLESLIGALFVVAILSWTGRLVLDLFLSPLPRAGVLAGNVVGLAWGTGLSSWIVHVATKQRRQR